MRRLWTLNRVPLWMRRALALSESEVPQNLVVATDDAGQPFPPIQCTLDAMQNGIGIAEQIPFFVQVSVAATEPQQIVPADENASYLIVGGAVGWLNTAANRTMFITATPLTPFPGAAVGNALVPARYTQTIATDDIASWKDICGVADARIWVPPGFNVGWFAPDLEAGETFEMTLLILRVPAGFKPY